MLNAELLYKAIENIPNNFKPNHLAYLSLTSKNEFIFRDNVALYLDEYFSYNNKILISREHKRADIAILEKRVITDIIEFKSMYLHDSVKKNADFIEQLINDFDKNKKLINKTVKQFGVLIVVELIGDKITTEYEGVIKYRTGINRFAKMYKNDDMLQAYKDSINKNFMYPEYIVKNGSIQAGSKYNMDVVIHFWAIEKN